MILRSASVAPACHRGTVYGVTGSSASKGPTRRQDAAAVVEPAVQQRRPGQSASRVRVANAGQRCRLRPVARRQKLKRGAGRSRWRRLRHRRATPAQSAAAKPRLVETLRAHQASVGVCRGQAKASTAYRNHPLLRGPCAANARAGPRAVEGARSRRQDLTLPADWATGLWTAGDVGDLAELDQFGLGPGQIWG